MSHMMGIDIGTSGVKVIIIDEKGAVSGSALREYGLDAPRPGWAEQDPGAWWQGTCAAIRQALADSGVPPQDIAAVGLSGQMHGSVFLDAHGEVVRPALLWCDQRTISECHEITSRVGHDRLLEWTCNPALTGFTAPKILWLRNHEPQAYGRTACVLLPKDYIRLRLTGELATEVSDASGTLLFDVAHRRWSADMLQALDIPENLLPVCTESTEVSGMVSLEGAAATGLMAGTPVVGGGGDQAAGAIGAGIVETGLVSATIGTSGVVFAHTDSPCRDSQGRLHTFCHAVPGKWHVMGVTLSAGGSLRWYRDVFAFEEKLHAAETGQDVYELIMAAAGQAPAGSEGLVFLPYLTGERTPYPDPYARGVFFGISLRHDKRHFARAIIEGVTFSLADCLLLMQETGIQPSRVRLSGGGSRSGLWRQIQADVFNTPVDTIMRSEGAAFGAALLAGVGAGIYRDVAAACRSTVQIGHMQEPDAASASHYGKIHRLYRQLYPALQPSYEAGARLLEDSAAG